MKTNYIGIDIPKLGFGLMRLPMLGNEIDIEYDRIYTIESEDLLWNTQNLDTQI